MLPTIVSPLMRAILIECIIKTAHIPGEIWECGVYKGGSAALIAKTNKEKCIRLFDTFGPGIPISTQEDIRGLPVGHFSITEKEYNNILQYFFNNPNVFIYRGIIPNTFKGLENSIISLVHIDLDQYLSYKTTLEFCSPRMSVGGLFVLDDYNYGGTPGATLAVNEFLKNNPNFSLTKHNDYGGYLTKNYS